MNNFYTLHSLVGELRYEISGKEIMQVWSSRKDQLDFFFHPGKTGKLTFSGSSPGTALFLDPRAAQPSRNAASFFSALHGRLVRSVGMVSPMDRYVRITFEDTAQELLFMPFTARPNVFLVDSGWIVAAFKNSTAFEGKKAPSPRMPAVAQHGYDGLQESDDMQQKDDGLQEGDDMQQRDDGGPAGLKKPIDENLPVRKKILAIDPQFPRGIIEDVVETCDLEGLPVGELKNRLVELRQKLLNPVKVSITANGHLSLLSPEYLVSPPERILDSVNEAVRTLFLSLNRHSRLVPQKNELEKKIQKRMASLKRQMEQFHKEPERLQKADELEHLGHLLISQPDSAKPVDTEKVTVADWADGGRERTISITPGETLVAQAERFYDKAARIRKDVAMSGTKKKNITDQQQELQGLLDGLLSIGHPGELDKWIARNAQHLQRFGLAPGNTQIKARPYRLVNLDQYEVWIGKNSRSNDEILNLSHKEDIWMHARGTSGSHVIIRNGGNTAWPARTVLLRAASYAAAYSRLSGSAMVPVIMAKRKHVRKPKGARPGQVTVTREHVEMVEPEKPVVSES
ncbi:MAG: NFACT RNA binding domain-containing protein [Cyclonatronaceae bacterium]